MARRDQRETLPQNTGHPVPDNTPAYFWRNSVLVGPQTAGIPTVHNEDEGARESTPFGSDNYMNPKLPEDRTGGAIEYHRSQRRK